MDQETLQAIVSHLQQIESLIGDLYHSDLADELEMIYNQFEDDVLELIPDEIYEDEK